MDNSKKDILFVINNLNVGGAEKALISLLKLFDYDKYNVDLLLFKKEGLFLKQVPKEVNILHEPLNYKYFDMPFSKVIKDNFLKGNWNVIYRRIQFKLNTSKSKNSSEYEQFGWKPMSKTLIKIPKKYDVAIGFLEKNPIYFVVDKVDATKKIGWIHTDYEKSGMHVETDRKYFEKLTNLVTVSIFAKNKLDLFFPTIINKTVIVQNIVNHDVVVRHLDVSKGMQVKIISVGRLEKVKSYDLGISVFKILKDKGVDFIWEILGEGSERKNIECEIHKAGLQKQIKLLGNKENIYDYLINSNVFLHLSQYEGDGIAIREAKLCGLNIVLTDFETADLHIKNGINGFICQRDPKLIADRIMEIINDNSLQEKLIANLKKEKLGNENEVEKLYHLINL